MAPHSGAGGRTDGTSAAGGNDYYETAAADPDVVLADLIKILHPDLLPDHTLVYYRQLQ